MKKVVITGQSGFIGTHLFNYLKYVRNSFELIPFEDKFFQAESALREICRSADIIVHLAALNRHNDPGEIYRVNMGLVEKLIDACQSADSKPHVIFASSTQEERDSQYGRSKREGRKLFENWALRSGSQFTAMIIPNVFGPFGVPYYNSVISTFCHQLTHDEKPKIEVDGELSLVYVGELVEEFHDAITNRLGFSVGQKVKCYEVPTRSKYTVSDILVLLDHYAKSYFEKGIIPELKSSFELNLFNTFRSYIALDKFPFSLAEHSDERGTFVEIIRAGTSGQLSYSTTKPGNTRGNHFHARKIERFVVLRGRARIELRRIGTAEVVRYTLDGERPSFVDMPVWHTHSITNIGDNDLLTLFWTNGHYDPEDPDTYFEKV